VNHTPEATVRSPLVTCCLAALTLTVLAAPGRAQIIIEPPCCSNSTIPACIAIMGRNSAGVPDPLSEATVTVRDLANQPVAGASIVIDFSACTELRLCSDPHDPGVTVNCAARTVQSLTDAAGVARFRVTGWSVATPGSPGSPYHSAKIFADGVLLGSPSVQLYDLDRNGLGAPDLSNWLADFFSGNNAARDDYDCSGSLGPPDLSAWLKAYFASGSSTNCVPEGPCP